MPQWYHVVYRIVYVLPLLFRTTSIGYIPCFFQDIARLCVGGKSRFFTPSLFDVPCEGGLVVILKRHLISENETYTKRSKSLDDML